VLNLKFVNEERVLSAGGFIKEFIGVVEIPGGKRRGFGCPKVRSAIV
jgi:hypothetical protein